MESSDLATLRHGSRADDVEQEDALLGRTLDGRYRIVRRLGRGGMGAVYEAEHVKLEVKVAIKVLQASLSANEKYRKRFLREARAASAIESEHIVRSSDFGATEDGLLYFAMELMEGQDLEQHLQSNTRIDWPRFEPVLFQITDALRAAHRRGVIHRDIKPSNCFLCRTEAWPPLVKVLDFGIAKINATMADGESPVATLETLTATNELFGTIAYMAPELIEGHAADARSDIYAVGVLMFRALTGRLPFTSPNVYKVLQQHVSTPVPSLRALVSAIPAAVESVVFRAMAKRPEHRYQSIAELEAALRAAREGIIEPSAEALSGYTEAVPRGPSEVSGLADAPVSGDVGLAVTLPNAHAVTQRVDDPGSLVSTRIRAPRFSPLAMLGLAVAVSSGTAVTVFSLVETSRSEPESASTAMAAPAPAPEPSPGIAPSAPPAPTPKVMPETETKEQRAEAPAPEGAPTSPARTPKDHTPAPISRKGRTDADETSSPPKPRSLAESAGEQCPAAIGERFTIQGLLSSEGRYIEPEITGGTKASRACIDAFIRTRNFGKGRTMQQHTEQLTPR